VYGPPFRLVEVLGIGLFYGAALKDKNSALGSFFSSIRIWIFVA
jgi:hypothetical protein